MTVSQYVEVTAISSTQSLMGALFSIFPVLSVQKFLRLAKIFRERFSSRRSQQFFTALLRSNETILKMRESLEIAQRVSTTDIARVSAGQGYRLANDNNLPRKSLHQDFA